MSSSPWDAVDNASTLGGVFLGAVVATAGSFLASWYERRLFRREREADAALVFAEILNTLAIRLAILRAAHGRGEPFGPITIRMARGVRSEVEIYDRNRERLFMVRDHKLRPQTSTAVGRLTFALDRVLDSTEALAGRPSEAERAELIVGRDQAFEFLMESAGQLPGLIDRFAKLANTPVSPVDLENLALDRLAAADGS